MDEYTFVRIHVGNLPDLALLYRHCFKINPSQEFLRKKFDTKRFGAEWLGYLAMDSDGNPAAYYGVFPCICDYFEKKILVAQSGDTMTHPNHRGKGLFIKLASKTFELAESNGVRFVFGFPNKQSYPGFVNKLNWIHTDDLNCYKIGIKTLPLSKIVKKVKFLTKPYSFFCRIILRRYLVNSIFENSLLSYNYSGISHDKHFFEYKKYNESFVAAAAGKKFWFKIDGRFWVGDIEPCSFDEFELLIDKIKHLAKLTGSTNIIVFASKGTVLNDYLYKYGVIISKNPVAYLDFNSGLDFKNIKYGSSDFDTF